MPTMKQKSSAAIRSRQRRADVDRADAVALQRYAVCQKIATIAAECASLNLRTTAATLDSALMGVSKDIAKARQLDDA